MRGVLCTAVGLAVWAIAADVAEAACRQRDLAGRWVITGIGTTGTESAGVECNLAINRRGRVDGFCVARVLGFSEELPIFGGSLNVRRDCAVGPRGELRLSRDGEILNGIRFNPDGVVNLTGIKVAEGRRRTAARTLSARTGGAEAGTCGVPRRQLDGSPRAVLLDSICQLLAP